MSIIEGFKVQVDHKEVQPDIPQQILRQYFSSLPQCNFYDFKTY